VLALRTSWRLVTSDKQLIQKATVPALTPADMTALLETRV
jgi:hypothetical protein